jgi:peptidyl-prolyl cis-trans isomerase D
MLDNPEARMAILDDLINQRLLLVEAGKNRMFASDAVRQTIAGVDAFKVDGKFSTERYEAALRAQGMTPQVSRRNCARI